MAWVIYDAYGKPTASYRTKAAAQLAKSSIFRGAKGLKLRKISGTPKKNPSGGTRWEVYQSGHYIGQVTAQTAAAAKRKARYEWGSSGELSDAQLAKITVRKSSTSTNPRKVKLPSKWTNAKVRVDQKGNVQIGLAQNPFLGKGGTLAKGVKSVTAAAKKVARKVKRKR